jgi:DNA helicase HerA-like ATPase
LIFEFNFWNKERNKCPVLVVYEEAHNYIPRNNNTSAKISVERIAKEGRKYGVSLMVVSQRPSELSETVLSQCNSYINLRITNPDDQNYIKSLVSDQNAELMDMLPDLRRGEALVIGEGIVMPMRVIITLPNDTPRSADVQFYKHWNDGIEDLDVKNVIDTWWRQNKV